MMKEKINLYKIFWFCNNPFTGSGKYLPINGLWCSIDDLFNYLQTNSLESRLFFYLRKCSFIKIPFFGYHSPQFTALDPRAIAVNEKAEV